MAPDDPADDPDLRARVAELEATVEQQQATIEQLLPTRRRVLQAGGLVAGGGVLGALTADRASAQASGQVGTSSDPVDVEAYNLAVQNQLSSSVDAGGNDINNVGSVNTDEADVTAETDISSTLANSVTGIASGTYETPADTEESDNLNEQDSNFVINLDESGKYHVCASAGIRPGSDQDTLQLRLRDLDNASSVFQSRTQSSGTGLESITLVGVVSLSADTNYEFQATDLESSWELNETSSFYQIHKSVNNP